MPQFTPIRQPFDLIGVDLVHPADRIPQGKYPYTKNTRSVQDSTATARPGYGAPVNAAPFDQTNVHSIRRMNNTIPGANPTSRRFVGAGTSLYSADAGIIDTGYSGNPLSMVVWRPDQSVEPWLYVGDSLRMQKCRMDVGQTHYDVGITPPRVAPNVILDQPHYKEIANFASVTGWTNSGDAGSPSSVNRSATGTIIGVLAFQLGSLHGWVNVVPFNATDNYGWIGLGMLLTFDSGGANQEEVVVQEVHLQIAASTISGVAYDVGANAFATVQAVSPLAGVDRNSMMEFAPGGTVNTSGMAVTWVSGYKFDSSWAGKPITIGGVVYAVATVNSPTSITLTSSAGTLTGAAYAPWNNEIVSVDSYTVGPDGLYSFRCYLEFTHVAGEPILGRPSFRCYMANPTVHVVGETITATAMKSTVTFSTGTGKLTNTSTFSPTNPLDLTQASAIVGGGGIAGRPLTPDDYLHISLLVDAPANITQMLIQLDVDATTNNFTQNYYQLNVQQNLAQELLTGGATALTTLSAAATATLINEVVAPAGGPGFAGAAASENVVSPFLQLYSGNNAWTEILIPLAELQRIGSDTTRSLANVAAMQILIQATATINVEISSWWVGGGYGPNTGLPEAQYLTWRYRYRSSLTGAKSLQSPTVRTGLQAYRQQAFVIPAVSTDPQVDLIDIERFGGVLNEFHYVGTVPNNAGQFPFVDPYSDDEIKNAPALETDVAKPFVSFDVPMTGTCNVVGTRVTWASGAQFNVNWAPGQEILIGGIPYTIFGQPESPTAFTTVQNVGVLVNAPFLVAEPTLLGQPLPFIIGPFDEGNFLLAWGDPRNPGTVYATKGNDPDAAPISYYLEVSNPSEPIVGGVIWDNNAIVASNKRFWRIAIDRNAVASGQGNVLVKQELQVGRGLFAPWAICAGPLIWFLDEAGVPCETDGSRARSIVEEDLRPIFPHDGGPGETI